MIDAAERADAHLDRDRPDRAAPAAARREGSTTRRGNTVARASRRRLGRLGRFGLLGLWLALGGACAGNKPADMHVRAENLQGACCEHLQGGERDRCLAEIPRAGDPEAARHQLTQRTYECVAEHFVCDPATGRPTQPSAQAQLDCIQDQE